VLNLVHRRRLAGCSTQSIQPDSVARRHPDCDRDGLIFCYFFYQEEKVNNTLPFQEKGKNGKISRVSI
jgi:hypothetical protein